MTGTSRLSSTPTWGLSPSSFRAASRSGRWAGAARSPPPSSRQFRAFPSCGSAPPVTWAQSELCIRPRKASAAGDGIGDAAERHPGHDRGGGLRLHPGTGLAHQGGLGHLVKEAPLPAERQPLAVASFLACLATILELPL